MAFHMNLRSVAVLNLMQSQAAWDRAPAAASEMPSFLCPASSGQTLGYERVVLGWKEGIRSMSQ